MMHSEKLLTFCSIIAFIASTVIAVPILHVDSTLSERQVTDGLTPVVTDTTTVVDGVTALAGDAAGAVTGLGGASGLLTSVTGLTGGAASGRK